MAAPKIDYEEEFFHGMTVPRLAQLFRLDRRTVTEKLRPLRPTGDRRGVPTYHIHVAAPYLVEPIIDIEKYLSQLGPGDLPPALQAQYWSAQNSKLKYKEQAGDLWRTAAVVAGITKALRSFTQSIRLLADRVQAQKGLTSEQRKIIEREICDKGLVLLQTRLVEDFSGYNGIKDKEDLAPLDKSEFDDGADIGLGDDED